MRTARKDQLCSDLGTSAERTDANVTTRQFLRYNAHRRFGQAETAKLFRDGKTKDTHFCEFFDDLHRDQFVLEVPFVGERLNFFQRVTTELVADHLQFLIQTRRAEHGRTRLILHDLHQARTSRLRITSAYQRNDFWLGERIRNTEVREAQDFALRHRNAAFDLREVFAECDLQDDLFDFAEFALGIQTIRPAVHFFQRFDVGRQPSKAVRNRLMGFNQTARHATIDAHLGFYRVFGRRKQFFEGCKGCTCQTQKVLKNGRGCHSDILSVVGHGVLLIVLVQR